MVSRRGRGLHLPWYPIRTLGAACAVTLRLRTTSGNRLRCRCGSRAPRVLEPCPDEVRTAGWALREHPPLLLGRRRGQRQGRGGPTGGGGAPRRGPSDPEEQGGEPLLDPHPD